MSKIRFKLNQSLTAAIGIICSSASAQALVSAPLEAGMVVTTCEAIEPNEMVIGVDDIRKPASTGGQRGTAWDNSPDDPGMAPLIGQPDWIRSNLGQVFGIAIGKGPQPDIFTATTDIYSRDIYGPEGRYAVWRLRPNGGLSSGGYELFYKFASTASNQSLGQVAYNSDNNLVYAVNRDGDTINAIADLGAGALGTLTTSLNPNFFLPAASGDRGKIFAVQYHPLEKRVYYSVKHAGNEVSVWSVGLNASGGFSPSPPVKELKFSALISRVEITDIAFDNAGTKMIVAERGLNSSAPHASRVMHFQGGTTAWNAVNPDHIQPVGEYTGQNNSAGGVDFTYAYTQGAVPDIDIDPAIADGRIVASGNYLVLSPRTYGVQSTPVATALNQVFDRNEHYFFDLDGDTNGDKSRIGDVEAYKYGAADELCNMQVTGPVCTAEGKSEITVTMTNQSSYSPAVMTTNITGAPAGTTTSYSSSGSTHTTVISVDGSFSGNLGIEGVLTSAQNEDGFKLCCTREIEIEVPACEQPCLSVDGRWINRAGRWVYAFTVTDGSNTSSFNPVTVDITTAPASVITPASPLTLTGGTASGEVRFNTSMPLPASITFSANGGDECCTQTIFTRIPRGRPFGDPIDATDSAGTPGTAEN